MVTFQRGRVERGRETIGLRASPRWKTGLRVPVGGKNKTAVACLPMIASHFLLVKVNGVKNTTFT